MMNDLVIYVTDVAGSLSLLHLLLTAFIHLMFASGVARDVHVLRSQSLEPCLVPGPAWVLATILGGVVVAGIYWVLHHFPTGK